MYEYNAVIVRVIDADTVRVVLDLGFDVHIHQTIRLSGINAPEMSTKEGKEATLYVRYLLPLGASIVVKTEKDRQDKYGRYLGKIYFLESKECLNDILIEKGFAVRYP